ncbi:hypothetical protein [Lichenibacterium dinghuense]|uniref:hypothetical protein n=1 Tax=Lichenibacterium dinghuense TaxID=2895977 RepID=UPI001F41A774|nr:hypothetical protein [Lichenibacterium sp. 6Y81]
MALDEQRNPFDDIGGDVASVSADHPLVAPVPPQPAPATPAPATEPVAPVLAAPAMGSVDEANPFDAVGPGELKPYRAPTTAGAAGLHEAERGVFPTIAAAGAFGPGAAGGAALGAFGGPFAPITVPAGALIGGLLTSTGAGYVTSKAQDYAISKLPESWQEAAGQDEGTRRREAAEHPDAVMLGGFAPMVLMASPGGFARTAQLAQNSTAIQRLMANPVTARMFGGTLMGGMELGQEKAEGTPIDWRRVATATAFGTVFNKPTRIGEAIETWGGRLGRGVTPEAAPAVDAIAAEQDGGGPQGAPPSAGTLSPEPGMVRFFHGWRGGPDPASGGARWVAPNAEYARNFRAFDGPKTVHFFDATPEEVTPHGGWDEVNGFAQNFEAPEHLAGRLQPYTFPPTLAEAADLKVMGPGITEDVFRGDHVQDGASEMAAQETARAEAEVMRPSVPGPALHEVARRLDPEIFGRYDGLVVRLRRGPRKRGLRVSSRRDRGSGRPGAERPGQAATSRLAGAAEVGFQFHGSNSARRWAG